MRYIPGFEGRYSATEDGRIYSHIREGYLKPKLVTTGYHIVTLFKGRKRYRLKVHRLVAMAHLKKPVGKDQVNHKNCNKTNNAVDNLEWCTPLENMRHAQLNGLIRTRKLTLRERNTIKLLLYKGATTREIVDAMGVTENAVIALKY